MASEIADIRRFEAADFGPLLEAESQAWGELLHWDYASAVRIITNCLKDKRLSGYALLNGGRIEGYSFFLSEGGKGLIGDLFLLEPARSHARRLLDHVLETMLATPGVSRIEAQLPHFSADELEPCFGEYGFESRVRRFMILHLSLRPASVAAPDFIIEPWERKHDREAAQFIYHTYRGHVDAVLNDQYASAAGAARLIDNIFELGGCGEPVPHASLVARHRASQKLAGVVALTAVRTSTAHVPQVAVATEFQSLGLGTALLDLAFRRAEGRGYREVSLTVTDHNYGARRLYERLGFETFRTFGAFVWNLK